MPFARPTLAELVTRVTGDLLGRLEIDGPLLRRSMVEVAGTVWAGAVHTLYGFLDWAFKQLFGATAERAQLIALAGMYGLTLVPAAYAGGNVTCTGTIGTVVPAGTVLRLDAVTSYVTTTSETLVLDVITGAGAATLPVLAALAGALANIPATTALTFESPITGVNASAVVATGGLIGGEDEEDIEVFRARYLLRLREPPEGGADQDYEEWTLAAGVGATRAWVFPNELGLGTVVVRFVEDNNLSSIFPSGGDVATVQAALDAQRPVTAAVTAIAPTNLATAFTLHIVPDTTDTRAAVLAELADLFAREGAPGDGVAQGTILLSHINTAIGNAAGVTDYTLTVPSANVVPALGQLPTVGTPTWV